MATTLGYDTIVIGAGLAGLMAALGRVAQGQRVIVLAKGQGTTHWTGGYIDLFDASEHDHNPTAAVEQLIANGSEHPYRLVGLGGIEEAFQALRALCVDGQYPYVGDTRRNVLLPTAMGALRPTCLMPISMVAGDSRQLPDGRGKSLLVAGFHALRDFFPPLIAANLREQGIPATSVYLELPPTRRQKDFNPVVFARLFDEPVFRAEVGRQLRELVRQGGYSHIALPAVLGLDYAPYVIADLQAASGALIFEIPTLPPSVPGMRLYNLLTTTLERAGCRVQLGSRVLRGEGSNGRLETIYSEAAARVPAHRADRYVLATGGIAGGGLRGTPEGELQETALGLPVQAPDGRGAWFDARFLNQHGHPIFRAGIKVDGQFRPLDAAGTPIYENVQVAGSALAGSDVIREGCLEGVAVATGWKVGNL